MVRGHFGWAQKTRFALRFPASIESEVWLASARGLQDVASRSRCKFIWPQYQDSRHKTGRVHHTLSEHESSFFLAEFSDTIIDIREQFPLIPLDLSTKIAQLLGVGHPVIAYSKQKKSGT